jgi:flavorubredoxin
MTPPTVHEIAPGIHRISTFVPNVTPEGFTFNQFLVLADEPLLFHSGPRGMFPLVAEAVATLMPVEKLRWLSFGHVEADECGAMNMWLNAAPTLAELLDFADGYEALQHESARAA